MTRNELVKMTKDQLVKLAKKRFSLALGKGELKNSLVASTLKAFRKLAAKKKASKTVLTKKKTAQTAKPKTAKTAAKKKVSKTVLTKKKTAQTAKPKTAKTAAKKKASKTVLTKKKTAQTAKPKTAKIVTRAMAKKTVANKAVTKTEVKAVLPVATPGGKLLRHEQLDAEEIISDSKYHLADSQGELDADNGIPHSYMDDKVFLFVRDPHWIFASWDLHPDTPAGSAATNGIDLSKSKIVLRVYDVTDIEFDGDNAHKWFDMEPNSIHGSWHIEVPESGRSYLVEIGLKDSNGNFWMIARSNIAATPRASVSARTDEKWLVADEDFWQMYALSGGFQPTLSSSEMTREMRELLMKAISSGGGSGSAGLQAKRNEEDDFPFRLDCELVVYGQTRPTAEVTLRGEKISLREDGSFTVRFALPDGLQVIEVKAVSENKKYTVNITPTVTRSTVSFTNSGKAKIGGKDVL